MTQNKLKLQSTKQIINNVLFENAPPNEKWIHAEKFEEYLRTLYKEEPLPDEYQLGKEYGNNDLIDKIIGEMREDEKNE